jgi:hypothetical protein
MFCSCSRQRLAGAAGDQRSDLRRQAMLKASSGAATRTSRSEAPEEMIFLFARRGSSWLSGRGRAKRDAKMIIPRRAVEYRTVLTSVRPERSKDQRALGWRSREIDLASLRRELFDRTAKPESGRKIDEGNAGIIPGDWGKVGTGWLAQPLEDRAVRSGDWRQNSPVPLAGVAARQNANEELGGEER